MARIANVDTVVLSFPDFDLPDESFVRNYARLVPEIKELSMYGLGLSEVHDTLRWLSTVTNYPIASQFSKEGVVAHRNFSKAIQRSMPFWQTLETWKQWPPLK